MVQVEIARRQMPPAITTAISIMLVDVPAGELDFRGRHGIEKAKGDDIRDGDPKGGGINKSRGVGVHGFRKLSPAFKGIGPVLLIHHPGMIQIQKRKGPLPGSHLDGVKAGI